MAKKAKDNLRVEQLEPTILSAPGENTTTTHDQKVSEENERVIAAALTENHEYERFESLTRRLLAVPKSEAEKKRRAT